MKKTGLIALDLDGTLLNSEKQLSDRSREVLVHCIQKGIYIVPATGRAADGIARQVRVIPGVDYAITTNGAVVMDLKNQKVLKQCLLPKETALDIMNRMEKYHVMYDPYIKGRGISKPKFMENLEEYGIRAAVRELVYATRDVVDDPVAYVRASDTDVEKMNVFLADLSDRDMIEKELSEIPGLIVTSSMPNNIEINAEGATKGGALLWLAEYLGVEREAVMAFGDGSNDISMLKAAGTGVAMENGVQAAKEAADVIACSNDEDGVAKMIEQLVLGK